MARSLLNVPLETLHEQLVDLRTFLRFEAWAVALRDAGLDPEELARTVDGAVEVSAQAIVALRVARAEQQRAVRQRRRWCDDFTRWAAGLRKQLRVLAPTAPREVEEIRRRLGRRPGKRYASSRDALELTLTALQAHDDALRVETWPEDPQPVGRRLVEWAANVTDAVVETQRSVSARSREATQVRREAQQVVRRIRIAWELARHHRPDLPELPLDVLTAYTPSRSIAKPPPIEESTTPERDTVKTPADVAQSESDPGPSESRPGQGESRGGPSESTPGHSELRGGHSESRPGPSESRAGHSEWRGGP